MEMMALPTRLTFQRGQHLPKVTPPFFIINKSYPINVFMIPDSFLIKLMFICTEILCVCACWGIEICLNYFFYVLLGYELLFQPEVVRVYTSLLRESKNPSVLEAAAGAIQNLCAGRWTVSAHLRWRHYLWGKLEKSRKPLILVFVLQYGRYIRATVRLEKGLPMMAELLAHGNDRVVRAMSGALRNLAIDNRNCELLGKDIVDLFKFVPLIKLAITLEEMSH